MCHVFTLRIKTSSSFFSHFPLFFFLVHLTDKANIMVVVLDAGSAVTAKINSAAMRTTKEKERKSTTPASAAATAASNQRKK